MHFCADTNTVSDQIGLLFGVDCLEEVVDVFDVDYISKCSHGYGFFFFFWTIRAMLLSEGWPPQLHST